MAQGGQARKVKAVQTACDILEVLQDREKAGVTEIAQEVGRTKGSVHIQLSTLESNELIVGTNGEYRLSLRFIDLAETVKENFGLIPKAETELQKLADTTGEKAQFGTLEHGRMVYLSKATGENAVLSASRPGKRVEMHATALGKAMLAHLPENQVDEIIDQHGLTQHTKHTVSDRQELKEELDKIREQGFALDDQELIDGLRCIAAPILLDEETVVGSISVTGPSSRIKGTRFHTELPESVTDAAHIIGINIKLS